MKLKVSTLLHSSWVDLCACKRQKLRSDDEDSSTTKSGGNLAREWARRRPKKALYTLKTEWKVLICAANKVMKYFFSSLAYRQQTSHSLHWTSLSIATCCRWLIPAQGSLCSAHNKLFFKLFVYTRERTTSLLFFIIHASLHFETVCFRSDEKKMICGVMMMKMYVNCDIVELSSSHWIIMMVWMIYTRCGGDNHWLGSVNVWEESKAIQITVLWLRCF